MSFGQVGSLDIEGATTNVAKTHCGKEKQKLDPIEFSKQVESYGAGELLVNSIDRDGTGQGYDLNLIKGISSSVSIPVIACGGAGKLEDFSDVVHVGGASAVAAGSMFVFYGRHRAVLITYPSTVDLRKTFEKAI